MKVIHNNFAVAWKGALFAITDGKDIYIDDNFYQLSNNLKKIILKHEEGHIVLNHVNANNDMFSSMLELEKEADEYAFRHTSIESAQEFIELLSLDDSKMSKSRVTNIKSLIAEQEILNSGDEDRINALLELYDEMSEIFNDIAIALQK